MYINKSIYLSKCIYIYKYIYIYIYIIYIYIMKCEWLKNESDYVVSFVTSKYFRLIWQPLQIIL